MTESVCHETLLAALFCSLLLLSVIKFTAGYDKMVLHDILVTGCNSAKEFTHIWATLWSIIFIGSMFFQIIICIFSFAFYIFLSVSFIIFYCFYIFISTFLYFRHSFSARYNEKLYEVRNCLALIYQKELTILKISIPKHGHVKV